MPYLSSYRSNRSLDNWEYGISFIVFQIINFYSLFNPEIESFFFYNYLLFVIVPCALIFNAYEVYSRNIRLESIRSETLNNLESDL